MLIERNVVLDTGQTFSPGRRPYILSESGHETVNVDDQPSDKVSRGQPIPGVRARPVRIVPVEHGRVLQDPFEVQQSH